MSILDYVDEVVYFDGNSTDGTLKLLDYIKAKYDTNNKIRVFNNKDFSDFKSDYVLVFNECMKACTCDFLFYIHPDMILTDPGILTQKDKMKDLAYSVGMRSFGGEDLGLEIVKGRADKWKLIMKNAMGLHYAGFYGAPEEDMYFSAITGKEHTLHKDFRKYPYRVADSGIKISHFCECKPKARREQKMETVLVTNGVDPHTVKEALASHPRVHLGTEKNEWGDFKFEPRKDPLPDVFQKHREEFEAVLR
jgi:hypothetical protein